MVTCLRGCEMEKLGKVSVVSVVENDEQRLASKFGQGNDGPPRHVGFTR